MSDALRQLLAVFDVDSGKAVSGLKTLDNAIENIGGKLGNLVNAFIGSALVKGLDTFIEGQISAAKETRLAAEKLGVGTEQLQEFQFAASAAGVSAEGAATGLKFLNKNLGLAIEGNAEASEAFKGLGIDLSKVKDGTLSATDVLPQIADKFAAAGSNAERTALAMKIFGRQGADLIPLLDGGGEGLAKLTERFHELGGGMDGNFIAKAKDAGKALSGMRFGIEAFKRQIAVQFFPAVAAFGQRMQTVIAYINRFAKETYLAKELAAVFGAAAAAAAFKAFVGFSKFLGILPRGGGLLRSVFNLGWIGLVVAAVVALGLVFEDIFVMIEGGDSVVGELIEKFFGVGSTAAVIEYLHQAFDQVFVACSALIPIATTLGSIFVEAFGDALPYILNAALFIQGRSIAGMKIMIDLLLAVLGLSGKLADAVGENVSSLGSLTGIGALSKLGGALSSSGLEIFDAVNSTKQPAYLSPSGRGAGQGGNQLNQNNQTVINVNGAGNPQAVGQAVASQQRKVFDNDTANAFGALAIGLAADDAP